MKLKTFNKKNASLLVLDDKNEILFSYETPVAALYDGTAVVTSKRYSTTTSRHINEWLEGRDSIVQEQEWFDTLLDGDYDE
jgi:hypothetical protein